MTATAQRTLLAAWGLFAAVLLLMVGRGLLGVVLGVRAELEGFTTVTTGVVMASYFVGFLAGARVTPRFMARVGHIRVFSGLAAMVAAAGLLHALWAAPGPWIVLRLVFGFGMAGLFVVAESWLNDTATNENRGRVMATYMVVSMGGVGLGQLLLGTGDPATMTLFLVTGALMSLAVVPITLSIGSAPEFELPPRQSPKEIWGAAPVGLVAAVFAGLGNSALLAMGAVYASQVGMTTSRTAIFVGAAAFGAVVLQWPIGYLSDFVGRRRMIGFVSALAVVVAIVGASLDPFAITILVAMFVFGGMSFSMYSLALSHLIDVLPPGKAVAASSTNVFLTGLGAIAGPLLAALAMTLVGPSGFWWTLAGAFTAIGLFVVYRVIKRPKIKGLSPEPYLAVPARSAGIVRYSLSQEGSDDGSGEP